VSRLMILFLAGLLAACGAPPVPPATDKARPVRIVSLDYCADQYVLEFADRDRILAVSPDADKDFSYMRGAAHGVKTVRPIAEDVLLLKPDLVVRSYGGGPEATHFFERAGIPVLDVGWAGDLPGVLANVQRIADGLGEHDRGAALVAETQARLDHLSERSSGKSALYMTPGGVTSGPGSLVHEMIRAAGLDNFQQQPGWRSLPLERLAYEAPDVIAAAFFGSSTNHPGAWSPTNHPVARAQLADHPVVSLDGAWTSCNGWFLIDAIEALAQGSEQ
jgi:iron complex transport system substrate-binding protein